MNKKIVSRTLFAFVAIASIVPDFVFAQSEVFATNRKVKKEPLSYDEIIAILTPKIMAIPSVRGVAIDETMPHALRITHSTSLILKLENFHNQVNNPRANREFETDKFVKTIAQVIKKANPFAPENLRIVIRTKEALDDFEAQTAANGQNNLIVRRPFMGDLEEAVVAETRTSIAFMPIGELGKLNLSDNDAFNLARKTFENKFSEVKFVKSPDKLIIAKLDGAFDASLMAMPLFWQQIEEKNKFPIAAIFPNRGLVEFGRANSIADLAKLEKIAKKEAVGPHAISDKVYIWNRDHWEIAN